MYKLYFDFAFGDKHVESFYNRVSEKVTFNTMNLKTLSDHMYLGSYALGLKSNRFVDIKFFN